jgi:hypothetical protein
VSKIALADSNKYLLLYPVWILFNERQFVI